MALIKAFLFDMDGVVTNTEVQYDLFLESFIDKYNLPEDFLIKVKGVRWPDIIDNYFSHLSEKEKKELMDEVSYFEFNDLEYIPIPGVIKFIEQIKQKNYKLALVTSSLRPKTELALKKMGLEESFDIVITGSDVELGKPAPDCYLLAAERLGVKPLECIVFEDSFAGIEAGKKAEMKVIALSTTNPEKELKEKVTLVYPDFQSISLDSII